ncbi:hypothetical protein E2C01_013227 [Portunus trituberculatus]|uniref:RAI1-like domain-containing protein n=1 Tax=Portunus trituberculatus TaxID=210409 RepID=A0A5B7DFQ3_PORTR|nr:hypothetical protein [Portunus trituberculatus]
MEMELTSQKHSVCVELPRGKRGITEDDNVDGDAGEWEPSVCINFLAKFLNFVKEKVLTEPDQIHCFERSASAGKYFLHYHANETSILPKWYTQLLFAPEEEQ